MAICGDGVLVMGMGSRMTMEEWRRRNGIEEWNFNITFNFFTKRE